MNCVICDDLGAEIEVVSCRNCKLCQQCFEEYNASNSLLTCICENKVPLLLPQKVDPSISVSSIEKFVNEMSSVPRRLQESTEYVEGWQKYFQNILLWLKQDIDVHMSLLPPFVKEERYSLLLNQVTEANKPAVKTVELIHSDVLELRRMFSQLPTPLKSYEWIPKNVFSATSEDFYQWYSRYHQMIQMILYLLERIKPMPIDVYDACFFFERGHCPIDKIGHVQKVSSDVEPLRIKPQAKTKERMQYIKDGLLVKDIHTFSDHTVVYHYTEEVISNVKIPVVFYKWISKYTEFNY